MLKIGIILLFVVSAVYLETMVKNANNYGPYSVVFEEYGDCKGPKAKNLTILKTSMDKQRLIIFVDISFVNDTKVEEFKVIVNNIKDNKKIFLWNYKSNEPCKHFAMGAILKEIIKANNNCVVKKGNYSNEIRLGEVIQSFLGTSFFYGTFGFRADLTSKRGNIGCFVGKLSLKKNY